jgi:O-antigen ligase
MARALRQAQLQKHDLALLALALAAALAVGVVAAASSPLYVAAAAVGGAVLGLIWARASIGVFLFIGIVAILPFGVVPVPLGGAQLTFVDAVMIATFSAVLARVVIGGKRLSIGAPGIALIGFVIVACAAFLHASAMGSISPEMMRRFGKLVVSLLFFVVARTLLSSEQHLAHLARWLMVAGAVQGTIGTVLAALPPLTQLTLLTRLRGVGYPTSDVLRYVPGANDTYTSQLRAIGTSVDPNVFGGTLMLALAVIVVQWASPRPLLPRLVLIALAIPTTTGILLSLSRASWLGLAAGLLLIGALRYRRLLLLLGLAGLALLATPTGFEFVRRFVSGFSTADRATAFRVGEYSNALTLIQRYPILGIGFGQSPDIDVTAGVSSIYLLVAEQTGLVGFAVFAIALGAVWLAGMRGLRTSVDPRRQGLIAAFLTAISAALVAGLLDHYFANQAFPHAVALFWLYAAALCSATAVASANEREAEPERAALARAAAFGAYATAVQLDQVPRNR